jgi:hypothetical protein
MACHNDAVPSIAENLTQYSLNISMFAAMFHGHLLVHS